MITDGNILLHEGIRKFAYTEFGNEYDFIGGIIWTKTSIFADIIHSDEFKAMDENLFFEKYTDKIDPLYRKTIIDMEKVNLPKTDKLLTMIRKGIVDLNPGYQFEELGDYEIKSVIHSSPQKKYQAVLFGLKSLAADGVLVTDGSTVLDFYYSPINYKCQNGCGGKVKLSIPVWEYEYFKFNKEICTEEGCKTTEERLYPVAPIQ